MRCPWAHLHATLGGRRSAGHAGLDLGSHRNEGLLDVGGILGGRFQKRDAKAVSEFLGCADQVQVVKSNRGLQLKEGKVQVECGQTKPYLDTQARRKQTPETRGDQAPQNMHATPNTFKQAQQNQPCASTLVILKNRQGRLFAKFDIRQDDLCIAQTFKI
jgi:hypothetical protein